MVNSIFKKDPDNKKLFITREFAGSLQEVWEAFTDSNILDQWWAPEPWKARTKAQDFTNGGTWLYSMNGPEGEQNWAKADYSNIVPMRSFDVHNSFVDENGVLNSELPGMSWKIFFRPSANGTTVNIEISFSSKEDLEQIVAMGFQEGFSAAHENLDRLLQSKTVDR